MNKIKILLCIDWYLPARKGGGQVVSVSNMVEALGDTFEFYILTSNHDVKETVPYAGLPGDQWVKAGKAHVFYASNGALSLLKTFKKRLAEIEPDIVYLNSFFSGITTRYLVFRYLQLIPTYPTILAPMGELSPGAIGLKAWKKAPYLGLIAFFGLCNHVIWRASSEREKQEIQAVWRKMPKIRRTAPLIQIAPDIGYRTEAIAQSTSVTPVKNTGQVKFIFMARISRKKNLFLALQWLGQLSGQVEFGIYGPLEDRAYWAECCSLIAALPENVSVNYYGLVSHADVHSTLGQYHFFLLPTLGENYGHAIIEAMETGLPVIISDSTPWHDLALEQAGWDIPLAAVDSWRQTLQMCVDMEPEYYSKMRSAVRAYLSKHLSLSAILQANADLLMFAYGH